MKLRQIEIKGFKSFKNRTVIPFGEGINCVVGPNGCGKSNVVDAFLWVMGETAPSHLRGSSMEDVIFTGSGQKPAMGVAEVSLVIERTKKKPFPSLYKDFSELMFTRRLDRDGKSNYFINSQSCRLKDIQEFFMDTGSGVHSFNFVEQGMVERFISSKPEQKRLLIESVAGISKFRIKKREAEKKLELTSVHIRRLKDLLAQQVKQLEKLQKQSEKAEQFRNIKEQIREKDIRSSVCDLSSLHKELQSLKKKLESKEKENQKLQDELKKLEQGLPSMKACCDQKKAQVEKYESELEKIKKESWSLEKESSRLEASLEVSTDNEDQFLRDIQFSQKNREEILILIKRNQSQIEELEKKQERNKEKLKFIQREFEELSESSLLAQTDQRSIEKKWIASQQKELVSQEWQQSVSKRLLALLETGKKLKITMDQKKLEMNQLQSRKDQMVQELEKEEKQNHSLIHSYQSAKKDLEFFEEDVSEKTDLFQKAHESASALYFEWEGLKKISSQTDEFEQGIQSISRLHQGENPFQVVADYFHFSSPVLEKSASLLLGSRLQSLLCEDFPTATSVLKDLKEEKSGRCRFVFKNQGNLSHLNEKEASLLKKESGFQFFFKNQVKGEKDLVEIFFSKVAVVQDVKTAFKLHSKYPDYSFFASTGEVLTKEGDLIGGECANEKMNFLSHRRAMREMPAQYEKLQSQENAMKEELKKSQALLQKACKDFFQSNEKKEQSSLRTLGLHKDLEGLSSDKNRLKAEQHELKKQLRNCEKKCIELQERQEGGGINVSAKNSLSFELKKAEREFQKLQKEKDRVSVLKDQLKVEQMGYEKEIESLKQKKVFLERSLQTESSREESMLSRSQQKKTLIRGYEKELKEQEVRGQDFNQKISLKKKTLAGLYSEYKELEQKMAQNQSQIIKYHQNLSEEKSKINDWKVQNENLLFKRSTLIEKVAEQHQEDLESYDLESKNIEESFDRSALADELKTLNARLSLIGAVNLLALAEHDELKKENEFYQKQYEDLCASNEKLTEAIRRIDRFCSEKFHTIFEQVNTCFSKVFPALFEGGKARMNLVQLSENEEQGVEILVQPPGKKIQNMNLLSGGEKAMTALAVIFSTFLVKPFPFCVLDEVDASLDDVNISRFHSLLSEISAISQVIIITHNKHTMKQASRLYGVTMEEKGISKILSIKAKDYGASTDPSA